MLVNRAKAEEAAEILVKATEALVTKEAAALLRSRPLELWTTDLVSAQYKVAVKAVHPDAGGSAEAFARVDWAKHALITWLGKNPARQPEMPVKGDSCPVCGGTGRVRVQHGFKSALARMCQQCQGTGEVMDVDRTGEGL